MSRSGANAFIRAAAPRSQRKLRRDFVRISIAFSRSNPAASQRQAGLSPEESRVRGLDLATQGQTFGDPEVFDVQKSGRSQSFLQRVGNAQQSLGGIIR